MTKAKEGWERALETVKKTGSVKARKAGIDVLAKLTTLQRGAFLTVELKGNNVKAAARVLGCSEADVAKHLKAAKEKLSKVKEPAN